MRKWRIAFKTSDLPFVGKWLVVNRSLEIRKLDRGNIRSPRAIHCTSSIHKHAVHAAILILAAIGDKAHFELYSHDVDTGILLHPLVFSSCQVVPVGQHDQLRFLFRLPHSLNVILLV